MGALGNHAGQELKKPHAVAVPCAFHGHITPFMDLCHLLASKGFKVTLVTTPRFRDSLKIEQGVDIAVGLVDDGLPADYVPRINDIPNYLHHFELLRWPLYHLLTSYQADESVLPLTCLISDSHLGWTQDVANDVGIPRICFLTSSTIEFSAIFHQPLLVSQGVLPLKGERPNEYMQKFAILGAACVPVELLLEGCFSTTRPYIWRGISEGVMEDCAIMRLRL